MKEIGDANLKSTHPNRRVKANIAAAAEEGLVDVEVIKSENQVEYHQQQIEYLQNQIEYHRQQIGNLQLTDTDHILKFC